MTTVVAEKTRGALEDAEMLEMHAHQLELSGDDMLAIRQMERALLIRCQAADGTIDVDRCVNASERLVVKCNTTAVKAFKGDDFTTGSLLLENALRLTDENAQPLSLVPELRQRLRGTTLNNFGCLERRRGRLEMALNFMRLSLGCAGQQSPATYLNISAIQLQLGQNQEAVGSARRSIGLLESIPSDYPGMIAVAYHNLAMALEGTDQAACLHAYETAFSHALRDLGRQSITTQAIEKNLTRFRAKHISTTSSKQCVALPSLTQRSEPYSVLPHPFVPAQVRQHQVSAPRRRESAPPSPKKPAVLAPVREKDQGKGVPKPPTAPQPSRLAPARSATRTTSEKAKQAEKEPETPRVDKEKTEVKDKDVKDDPKKAKSEKKEEAAKVISPAQAAQEEAHRSDDVVAFLHNRLCTLIQAEEQFEVRFRMATKIQCMTRCHFARKVLSFKRSERVKGSALRGIRDNICARVVTRFFRRIAVKAKERKQAAKRESQQLSVKTRAATKIQRVARKWLKSRHSSRARKFGAASTRALRILQCWFRQCLARKEVLRLRLVSHETQHDVLYRERLERAATDLQRVYRSHVVARLVARSRGESYALKEKEKQSRREGSAVTIQALVRGVKDRQRCAVIKSVVSERERKMRQLEDRRNAAITLQAWAKGMAVRAVTCKSLMQQREERAAATHDHRCRAATVIQCLFRRTAAVIELRARKALRLQRRTTARECIRIILIQAACRGFRVRSELSTIYVNLIKAGAEVTELENLTVETRQDVAVSPTSEATLDRNYGDIATVTIEAEPAVDGEFDEKAVAAEAAPAPTSDVENSRTDDVTDHTSDGVEEKPVDDAALQNHTSENQSTVDVAAEIVQGQVKADLTASSQQDIQQVNLSAVEDEPPKQIQVINCAPPTPAQPTPVPVQEFVPKPPVRPPSVESRIVHQARRDAKRSASAAVIQRVFRGHIDRSYTRKLKELLDQYIVELADKHRCDVEPSTPFNFELLNSLSTGLDYRIENTRQERRTTIVQQFAYAKLSGLQHAEKLNLSVIRREKSAFVLQRFFRFIRAQKEVCSRRLSISVAAQTRSDQEVAAFEKLTASVLRVQSALLAILSQKLSIQRMDQVRVAAAESIRNFALVVSARKELTVRREQEAAKRETQIRSAEQSANIVATFLLVKCALNTVLKKVRNVAAKKIQRAVRVHLARRERVQRRSAVDTFLASVQEADEAATVIQGAYRMASARAEVESRKLAKAEKWQNLQESEGAVIPGASHPDVETLTVSPAACPVADLETIDPQAGRDAAALVIQRNTRKMAAKQRANELREENRKKWEDKRRLAEQEEEEVEGTLLS